MVSSETHSKQNFKYNFFLHGLVVLLLSIHTDSLCVKKNMDEWILCVKGNVRRKFEMKINEMCQKCEKMRTKRHGNAFTIWSNANLSNVSHSQKCLFNEKKISIHKRETSINDEFILFTVQLHIHLFSVLHLIHNIIILLYI